MRTELVVLQELVEAITRYDRGCPYGVVIEARDKARALLEQQPQPVPGKPGWVQTHDPQVFLDSISDTGGQANAMQTSQRETHATVPTSLLECVKNWRKWHTGKVYLSRAEEELSAAYDAYIASQAQQRESPAGGQQSAKVDAGNAEQVSPDVLRDAERYRLFRKIAFDDDSFDAYDAEGMDAELDRRLADAAIAEGKR